MGLLIFAPGASLSAKINELKNQHYPLTQPNKKEKQAGLV
jgi:hypothetical protein